MLLSAFDDNAVYDVLGDDRQGFHILLVRKSDLRAGGLIEPLYVFPCRDRFSYQAAQRWFNVRRALWQQWGELADAAGSEALIEHIGTLLEAEPIGLVQGSVIKADAEPKVLCLGECVMTPNGIRNEVLYRHRFSTTGKRKRFFDWFLSNASNGAPERLIDLAISSGTAKLAVVLEQIAAGEIDRLADLQAA